MSASGSNTASATSGEDEAGEGWGAVEEKDKDRCMSNEDMNM